MFSKRSIFGIGVLFCLFALLPSSLFSQSSSTGTVAGTVTDPSGAAIVGATVTLTDRATNIPRTVSTNENGRYLFVDIPAGVYDLSVSKQGFRTSKVSNQTVSVNSALTLNVTLEIGAVAESVEVTATNAELQTLNATVGNTVSGIALDNLPSISRDASTFFTLQPAVSPEGSVAGVQYDQNSYQLDGGQNTNDMDGTMNIYTQSFAGDVTGGLIRMQFTGNNGGGPTGVLPTPIDSVEEFKVSTTNQTADFNSSAGSQVSMVTKRGTNNWHGTLYEYYLDNNWSANTFENNAAGVPVPSYHYSRFGGAVGGPIIPKEILGGKTYFFANYEGFRWPNSEPITRAVPSASLRAGLLFFNGTYYNLNPTPVTFNGVTYPGTNLDPRGIGVNSLVQQMWSTMPLPNSTACGGITLCDNSPAGGNIGAFTSNLSVPQSSNFGVVRLDHDFGSKWHFMSSYRYYKLNLTTDSQYTIANGSPQSFSQRPQVPWFYVAGLTTNISTNTTNDFHYSYLRNFWQWGAFGDIPQLSGLGGALEPLGEQSAPAGFALTPYNVDTQNTRTRFWDGQDNMVRDDISMLHGNHLFQFGGTYERNWDFHQRSDNGGGINFEPVYQLGALSGSGINMTGIFPAGISPSQQVTFGNDYAAALGMISIAQQAYTRSGPQLTLNPPLTPAEDISTIPFYNVYFSDSWHMKPSITFTYGLGWTLEMPPVEQQGRQVELVDQSGQAINVESFLKQREDAALQGQVYNPEIGFALVGNTGNGQKYPYNPFYGEFSPRLALAWNPNYSDGLLGKIFGQGKTVVRGGYSRIFGRLNGVDLVLVPLLGTGLIQPVQCIDPVKTGTCAGTLGSSPLNAFRIGTDGLTAPLPAPSATLPQPDFPGFNAIAAATGEALDTNFRPDESDQFDLTVQRQLNSRTMIEFGYIGRLIRNEYQPLNINAVPTMMTLNGQSFAKAFANLELEYCGGGSTKGLLGGGCVGNVGAVTPQPFFEAALSGTGYCTGFASCTQAVAMKEGTSGTGNLASQSVWSLWSDLDQGDATCTATTPCGFNFARTMMNSPIPGSPFGANGQMTSGVAVNASVGYGNYNAGFISLKMADWHGLTLQQNFTYSKALGTVNTVQATSEFTSVDPYNVGAGYGLQPYDRKFVDNVLLVYEPPVFKGQEGWKGRLLGGWSFSPIFTTGSGLPLELNVLNGDGQSFGGADAVNFFDDENAVLGCANNFGSSRHNGVTGSGGVGIGGNVNLFANPQAVFNCMRDPILGLDGGAGGAGVLRGMPFWNVDFQVRKNIHITERYSAEVQSIFTNVFNHDQLLDPVLSLANPAGFGVESLQANTPRSIELGIRFRF
jgi:hypothetical protein